MFSDDSSSAPLAHRARPEKIESFLGQEKIIKSGTLVDKILTTGVMNSSLIFYGPPGVGKTTLAHIIAKNLNLNLVDINATTSNIAELRSVINKANDNDVKTILLIDEIHRFNKTQQDALLKALEEGSVKLIGTTTENPFFAINKALLSRSSIVNFEPLNLKDGVNLLRQCLDKFFPETKYETETLEKIMELASGDGRRALTILEYLTLSDEGINRDSLIKLFEKKHLNFDKDGDYHYDIISAYIKSMRGSDPDAALLYLFYALEAGMDPLFLARRLVILSSEDIGLADPSALTVAINAYRAVEIIGLPEAEFVLTQATVHLALAYKSNALTIARGRAKNTVNLSKITPPPHLRDAHYKGSKALGVEGYKYPPDYPGSIVEENYWPEGVKPTQFYQPSNRGNESKITTLLSSILKALGR
jgi:putative ATPase